MRKADLTDLDPIVAANIALARESEGLTLVPDVVRRGVTAVLAGTVPATYFVATDDAGARSLRLYVDSTNVKAQQTYASVGMKSGHYLLFEADWGHE